MESKRFMKIQNCVFGDSRGEDKPDLAICILSISRHVVPDGDRCTVRVVAVRVEWICAVCAWFVLQKWC